MRPTSIAVLHIIELEPLRRAHGQRPSPPRSRVHSRARTPPWAACDPPPPPLRPLCDPSSRDRPQLGTSSCGPLRGSAQACRLHRAPSRTPSLRTYLVEAAGSTRAKIRAAEPSSDRLASLLRPAVGSAQRRDCLRIGPLQPLACRVLRRMAVGRHDQRSAVSVSIDRRSAFGPYLAVAASIPPFVVS